MKDYSKKIVLVVQQVQKELLEVEELLHSTNFTPLQIDNLRRPPYSRRVILPNLIRPLAKSLHELDFIGGIVVSQNGNVIDGWHRLEIWQAMGNDTIPCLIVTVTHEQERRLHLSLNRQVSQFCTSDFGFSEAFSGLDLVKDFGFTKADLLPPEVLQEQDESDVVQKNRPGSKLIAALPFEYLQRMEKLKSAMPAPNKSQVLIKLIDFYESNHS